MGSRQPHHPPDDEARTDDPADGPSRGPVADADRDPRPCGRDGVNHARSGACGDGRPYARGSLERLIRFSRTATRAAPTRRPFRFDVIRSRSRPRRDALRCR